MVAIKNSGGGEIAVASRQQFVRLDWPKRRKEEKILFPDSKKPLKEQQRRLPDVAGDQCQADVDHRGRHVQRRYRRDKEASLSRFLGD